MSEGSAWRGGRTACVRALAGTAFTVGVVALLEVAALALPESRAAFATWGPVRSAVAILATLVLGLPSALAVEAVAIRAGRHTLGAAALGYLLAAGAWAAVLLWLWRSVVDPGARPATLAAEGAALLGGALLLWTGARLAERDRPGPVPIFTFAGAAIVSLALASALALA